MTAPKTDEVPPRTPVESDTPSERAGDRDSESRQKSATSEAPDLHPVRASEPRRDDRDSDDGESDRSKDRPVSDLRDLTAEQRARLRKRLAAAVQLAKRAGSDGEKAAAMAAIERISLRLDEPVPDLDTFKETEPAFDFDFGAYERHARTYKRTQESVFEAWIRIVENDAVFVDIFANWAARARARGWHEGAVQAAQDYAAEYGVSPEDVDLGM